MKKIFLITQKKDSFSALETLRDLGVVHVEHEKIPEGQDITALKDTIQKVETVLNILSGQGPSKQENLSNPEQTVEQVISRWQTVKKLKEDIIRRHAQIAYWQDWGDFSSEDIEHFRKKGLSVRLLKIPFSLFGSLPKDVICEQIFIRENIAHCLVIEDQEPKLSFEEVPLSVMSLSDMKKAQHDDEQKVKGLEQEISDFMVYQDAFKRFLQEACSELQLHQALAGMGEKDSLSYLKGFCPSEACPKIQAAAQKSRWGLIVEEPSTDDQVPTLLKNPRWVEIIKPVFSMINVLPGYKEQDISLVFLLFFSVFFGILIGDAGYGLVFALLTGFADRKSFKNLRDKTPIYLMYILSAMTILWGCLTGTFFGQILFAGIKPFVPWLSDANNVQRLCFFIGALHLSIAHLWRGVLKWPSISAFSEVGWLCLLWGMFFMARVLVLGEQMQEGAVWLFVVGPALIMFFAKPNRNPLKALASGLADLTLNIVNTFTDIVSYIRLFAVGLATVAVADAFNVMALDLGFHNVVIGFFAALILILGHIFNMVLGAMAILVHGIRLNVLEFSSHMNLEWAGIKYQPFKKNIETD